MDRVQKMVFQANFEKFTVENVSPSDYPGYDLWTPETFKERLKVRIARINPVEIEFDIIGIDCTFANALRRILISEVPTMAIDKVHIYNNTSIIQDEVLAHRLGLIPLKVDPRYFAFRQEGDKEGTPEDTLHFELKVKCVKNPVRRWDYADFLDLYKHHKVFTHDIKWIPIGQQKYIFKKNPITTVHDNILIAKMRPGHEIDLKMIAVKGIGRDHAKFSPVSPASYRFHPDITLLREVEGDDALRLQKCFSPGVIEIVERNGTRKAKVANSRHEAGTRNVFRHDDLKDAVKLTCRKNHIIFTIESVGILPPETLFVEAVKILRQKCATFLVEVEELEKAIAKKKAQEEARKAEEERLIEEGRKAEADHKAYYEAKKGNKRKQSK